MTDRFLRLNEGGSQPPIVFFSTWVSARDELTRLAAAMGADQPIFGVESPSIDGPMPQDMDAWVRFHRDGLDALGLDDPLRLAGFSFGGVIAQSIACDLQAEGRPLAWLAMIDALRPNANPKGLRPYLGYHLREVVDQPDPVLRRDHVRRLVRGGAHRTRWRVKHQVLRAPRRLGLIPPPPRKVLVDAGPTRALNKAVFRGWLSHQPRHYDGTTLLLTGDENRVRAKHDPSLRWAPYLRGGFEVVPVPGTHMQILDHPNVEVVAAALTASLSRLG